MTNSFVWIQRKRLRVLLDPSFYQCIQRNGIRDVVTLIRDARIDPGMAGRNACRVICLDGTPHHRFVVRHYAHGGLLRRIMGDHFVGRSRPFREMELTEEIRRLDIPTIHVVAAFQHRSWGPFYRGDLVTEEIPRSRDLVSFFSGLSQNSSNQEIALRRDVARQAGHVVRAMHDRGVFHGDLNLKNFLIQTSDAGDSRILMIDFDRSKILKRLSVGMRMKNLIRLNRSVEKWKMKGVPVRYTDRTRFFQAYAQEDSHLVQAMRRYLKHHRIHAGWYRIGWLLDRSVNRTNL